MEKDKRFNFWQKIKENKNSKNIGKAVLMALLPLLCGMVYCAVQGGSLGQVYLPASEWNDELFYYKQVEGMIAHGYPYGYFGFNESHALKLSFAAWSPVLVIPYILWGLVFGWNLMAPIYCNIALMMAGFFLYTLLTKPTWKQMGILTLGYSMVTPITRYTLSGMPEALCFSLLTVYFGLAVSYQEEDRRWKLAGMLGIAAVLTLMRPYLILFLLLPMWWWFCRSRIRGSIGSLAVLGVTGGLYAAIKHYLGAEYFTPLFKTEWVETFFDKGILAGIRFVVWQLWTMGKAFVGNIIEAFRSGLPQGSLFAVFIVLMLLLLWQTWTEVRRKHKKEILLYGYLAFCFVGMLAALLLMYKLREGSKHLLTFIMIGLLALSRMETRFYKKAMAVCGVSAYLFVYMALDPYDYALPMQNEGLVQEMAEWEQVFSDKLVLQTEQVPSYDNVVIWPFSDTVEEKNVLTKWQILYALPEGFGISCCYQDYVVENFDRLQSRYISAPCGGVIDGLCEEAGFAEIARIGDTVVYQRY